MLFRSYGVRVEVLNVLGAGDAFMSGLIRGYINNEGWEQACRYANACGALVVSRKHFLYSIFTLRQPLERNQRNFREEQQGQ